MAARRLLFSLIALCLLLCACPAGQGKAPSTAATGVNAHSGSETAADTAGTAEIPDIAAPQQQLILMYTGDTFSSPSNVIVSDSVPPRGGVSSLAEAIMAYQRRIVDYNRLRVAGDGGDIDHIKADFENGMLGEHPYLLLDYGGWARSNDYPDSGAVYVGLYASMFRDLSYAAVGCSKYELLSPEHWRAYLDRTSGMQILVTAGEPLGETIPAARIVTREIHGDTWGIVSIPLPREAGNENERAYGFIEEAAAVVAEAGCDFSILMIPGMPVELYDALAGDDRFTVVIGDRRRDYTPEGYAGWPKTGPLMLRQLQAGGVQLGICHIYFAADTHRPGFFRMIFKNANLDAGDTDDAETAYPYRNQIAEAMAEHRRLVELHQEAAKIAAP